MDIQELKFDQNGLIPAILQDYHTREVLMQAYMNEEALAQTLQTGRATFYSRSRQQLWVKGETSGHFQEVVHVRSDCDGDCLLLEVLPCGPACHTGETSCFFKPIHTISDRATGNVTILRNLADQIEDRKQHPVQGSYTNYLFEEGIDKICKKIGEESAETIIAAKNNSQEELTYEASDLLYHLSVLLNNEGVTWEDLFVELTKRYQK
ncbi:MAG: bifunctional phosphoribosyl-AMP cyclohydrolase/phosphoribosyl-ATP diphosphatase HisIE [Eubacteriaceae bacterium]|jgi:phosphoribosyl-ATP pyrophosphohydrolase/phosphoribosyl-AMP cyclohydrolase|nr:bifunctional phosphoribosyl-AMP cyclohydrolase/phosphoribosyl-ATP diphosphatase HisIE [Eubacteriaceae bacterium]